MTPSHSTYGMAKHNQHAAHNHNSKGFGVQLDIAEKDFIEPE